MKNISIIVAVAEGNAIGKDNDLLCYISEDLKRFKRLTTGNIIIMGKKTFESLPKGALPNRTNIVITDKKGYFEQAEGGYLFLDEIASISPSIQAKILRAIENKEIRVVGGEQKKVDVKLIFASNKDLKQLVKNSEFRSDLYYRIARNVIFVPPLIEREDDIILLMNYFCEKHSNEFDAFLDFDLIKIKSDLLCYSWPGNVRELSSFCENLLIRYNIIDNDVIMHEIENKIAGKFYKEDDSLFKLLRTEKLSASLTAFEKKYLQYHIAMNNGNMSKTADEIGIERTTLYRKLKK